MHVKSRLNSDGSNPTQTRSADSSTTINRTEFAKAMAMLCTLKRSTDFTTDQLRAWYAVLSPYRETTINRAVLQVVASEARFPELSDILKECRAIETPLRPYNPYQANVATETLTEDELRSIAGRLQIQV